jgi:predicted RND superfamily exporter protein
MITGDPDRRPNAELKYEFSNDEAIMVALDLGKPFDAADLRKLRFFSETISQWAGVEEVIDLSNVKDIRSNGDALEVSPLVDFSQLNGSIEVIRERTRTHRLYRNNLVSGDLSVVGMLVLLDTDVEASVAHRLSDRVWELVRTEAPPWTAYVSGFVAVEREADRIVRRDLTLLTATALAAIALIVYLVYRRWFASVLLGLLILWTELVTHAWLGMTDTPLSVVTSAIPTIVVATSAAYVIYFLGMLARVSERTEAALDVLALLARPVLLSGLSTAIGFLSLRAFSVGAIQELGTGLAVSIVAGVVGTLTLLPAVTYRFDLRLASTGPRYFERLGSWGVRLSQRRGLVLWVAVATLLIVLPGLCWLRVDTVIIEHFDRDNRVRISDRFIQDHLAGGHYTNVVIRTNRAGGSLDPAVMSFADQLIEEAGSHPQADRVISFLDYLYLMDAALRPGEPSRTVLPSAELAAQYMLLYEAGGDPSDYRHYINHDRSALNILIRVSSSSSNIMDLRQSILDFARGAPDGVEVQVLGSATLFQKAMAGIASGMLKGLSGALVLVAGVMAVALRSARLAVVATIPNAIPILVFLALLGWLDVPVAMGTSVVGCIALGLAVDDTAHVIGHLTPGTRLGHVYRAVGTPLILTTLALGLGFSSLMFSEFRTIFTLGAMTAATLLLALICDLLLLPSLLTWIGYSAGE